MTEKLENVLVQLADKLSTTVPHLWEVLLKQAYISAITDLIIYAVFIVNAIVCWKTHKWCVKNDKYEEYDDVGWTMVMFIYAVISATLLIIFICCIGSTITAFINPEYFALKKIFGSCE